jgi:benzoyl-CoA reductase/2-hydroxyglutaryl-CoA dehydratase subunit BcrC/BadD/HgdB
METMLGWVCAYTPEEVFAALGIESYRLCGEQQATAMQHLLPVNICPLVRACLSEAGARNSGCDGAGMGTPLSGVVMAAACPALVHLANAFQHDRGRSGRFFVHLLDLPRTLGRENEGACLAFAASLRDLAGRLSEFYGVAWDDGAFLDAIERQQQVRLLLREIYRMRQERPEQFRAAGILELVRTAGRTRKEELAPLLRSLVASLRDAGASGSQDGGSAAALQLECLRRQGSPRGPRLLVTGSPLPTACLDLIEDLGGNVAGDDLCHGYRYCLPNVEEDLAGGGTDLFLALSRGYLQRPACPRMLPGEARFAYLQALVRECRAQGVVYHALKFCDTSLYDYALLRSRFIEAGIPMLYLETEYRDAGLEQARTRIQAFLELLGSDSTPVRS